MIQQSTIDKLLELNIVDVVSDYISLKKSGVNYKGCCPFHNERTPSFIVSPSKNIWHCFGCGKGGNAIQFIIEEENCNFYQACKILGSKYHIQVEEETEKDPEEVELSRKRESDILFLTISMSIS